MRIILCLAVLIVFVTTSCKKTYPTTIVNNDTTIIIHTDTVIVNNSDTTIYTGDSQVRFMLPTFGTTDSTFTTDTSYSVKKFNIAYYPGVDSVVWACTVTGITADGTTKAPVTLQLYNLTDNVPITGSNIQSAIQQPAIYSMSGNCVAGFPAKEIILGLKLFGSKQDMQSVNVYNTYLYLYRH